MTPTQLHFSEFFSKGHFETLPETIAVDRRHAKLTLGIPKECTLVENRVCVVPSSIRSLVGYGYEVIVESGAGINSNFNDLDYSETGAYVTQNKEEVFKADIIVKVIPPTLDELKLMSSDQTLISPLHLPLVQAEYLKFLSSKKVTAFAMEYMQSENGTFPIVRAMSEIAGMSIMYTAGELLKNDKGGRGILLGGVAGVPPTKVVVLGAGVVSEYAIKAALSFGASVRVFDNDITKLAKLQVAVGRQLHTSSYNPQYLAYQLTSADVVIGAIHSKHSRTPIIVTEEMVSKMKEGSVIIDVSIDQGGCFETSEVTTIDSPTFVKHGVIHYCVPNIPSLVSRTSSIAISNIVTPLLIKVFESNNIKHLIFEHSGIRNGCYAYKGHITNEYLAKKFEMKYVNLDLLLTSGL
jgi:alanine dehydrogenase